MEGLKGGIFVRTESKQKYFLLRLKVRNDKFLDKEIFKPNFFSFFSFVYILYTRNTASLAAKAKISAQETTPGQAASNAFFALSMIKNACKDTFGGPSFSALLLPFEFSSTDASHPFKNLKSKKNQIYYNNVYAW